FKKCDIAIVTNIAPDHLGMRGINTVEQMARLKGVVPETVVPEGYAILNADDDLVYQMREKLECNIALFSMDENNDRIKRHAARNGLSAIYENGFVTICKGTWKMRVAKVVNIPLTFGGKARFMIQNVLPAVLTGFVRGFDLRDIKMAIESFIPSPAQTPGRLNLFKFKDFSVLLDYAHNEAGMAALHDFIENLDGKPTVGIIAGIGDRREEDNEGIGRMAAVMFDEIIIRQDKNLRGKTEEELIDMLSSGIKKHDPDKKITIIPSEEEAITHAITNAVPGSLIVICSDVVPDALKLVQGFKEKEANELYDHPSS
ncbi:MAG: cyanophycin synthetase, partial [Saprospiraceae bacterium]